MNNIILSGAELKLASGLKEIDNDYPFLNDGGCLHVAKWIGESFIKRGVEVDYLILDNCSVGIAEMLRPKFEQYANVKSLEFLADEMLEISHILPRINKRLFIDSTGVKQSVSTTQWTHFQQMGYVNHKTIERWGYDRNYNWNPRFMYVHGHEMSIIEKKIKKLIKSLHI